jgi:hypothetical protein
VAATCGHENLIQSCDEDECIEAAIGSSGAEVPSHPWSYRMSNGRTEVENGRPGCRVVPGQHVGSRSRHPQFSWTGTATYVAANGDKLFTTISGAGTLGPPAQSTAVDTITGGTGRFADASGTITNTAISTSISIVGSIETVTSTQTWQGMLSY